MKKVLITRKLLRSNEDRISKIWDANLNLNDEVYSQKKLIELSQGCDGILTSLTEKIDENVVQETLFLGTTGSAPTGNIGLESIVGHTSLSQVRRTPELVQGESPYPHNQ